MKIVVHRLAIAGLMLAALHCAAQVSDDRSRANAGDAVRFRSIDPTTCLNAGQRFAVRGANFLTQGTPRLLLRPADRRDGGPEVELAVDRADANRLEVQIPRDTALQAGQRYQVGTRTRRGDYWSDNPPLYMRLCATPGLTRTAPAERPPPPPEPPPPPRPEPDPPSGEAPAPRTVPEPADNTPPVADSDEPEPPVPSQGDAGNLSDRAIPPAPQMPPLTAAAATEGSIEPQQIVILAPSMAVSLNVANQVEQYGLRIKTRQDLTNLNMVITVFRLPEGVSEVDMINQLRDELDDDVWIDTNQRYQLMGGEKRYGQAMVLSRACSTPLRLGMVDTPVWLEHGALRDANIVQKNFIDGGETAAAADHGTAVAGLLVGGGADEAFTGLLPEAELFAANAFRRRGDARETNVEWLALGLNWLAGRNVAAINLSIGGRRNIVVELTVQRVLERGIAVVAAAGNNGVDGEAVFPAAQAGVIAVTAVDVRGQLYREANRGDYISFAAPGVDIWIADPNGAGVYRSGTSFATPFVTALVALVRASPVTEGPWEATLQTTALDLGPQGKDRQFGWGLVQWPPDCP